jgi:hypothetical protein
VVWNCDTTSSFRPCDTYKTQGDHDHYRSHSHAQGVHAVAPNKGNDCTHVRKERPDDTVTQGVLPGQLAPILVLAVVVGSELLLSCHQLQSTKKCEDGRWMQQQRRGGGWIQHRLMH